jgi:hypothetical protein
MPVETVVRPEFAKAVREALEGMKPSEASGLTGISDVYIYKMLAGRVPSEQIIHKFAEKLPADEKKLRIAAGYDQPEDLAEYIMVCLADRKDLTDDEREEVMRAIMPVAEQIKAKRKDTK